MQDLTPLRGARVTLRPLTEEDLGHLARVVAGPGVREWWGTISDLASLREDLRNDGDAFAVEAEGALAGWLGFAEEEDRDYRHASLDIVLAPQFQDRGLGSEALRLAIGWLVSERGHHRITIDPAAHNHRAIRAYEAVGFRPVGILRSYERGPDGTFHDGLLMDLLAEDLGALTFS